MWEQATKDNEGNQELTISSQNEKPIQKIETDRTYYEQTTIQLSSKFTPPPNPAKRATTILDDAPPEDTANPVQESFTSSFQEGTITLSLQTSSLQLKIIFTSSQDAPETSEDAPESSKLENPISHQLVLTSGTMPRSLLDNFVTIEDLYRYIVDNCNDQRRVEIQHTGIKIVKRQMVKEREIYRTMYLPFSQNKVGSIESKKDGNESLVSTEEMERLVIERFGSVGVEEWRMMKYLEENYREGALEVTAVSEKEVGEELYTTYRTIEDPYYDRTIVAYDRIFKPQTTASTHYVIPSNLASASTLINGNSFGLSNGKRIIRKNPMEKHGLSEEYILKFCTEKHPTREKIKFSRLLLRHGYSATTIIRMLEARRHGEEEVGEREKRRGEAEIGSEDGQEDTIGEGESGEGEGEGEGERKIVRKKECKEEKKEKQQVKEQRGQEVVKQHKKAESTYTISTSQLTPHQRAIREQMFKILKEKKLKRLDQILLYLQEQGIETNISELKMHIDFFKRKQEKRRLLGQAGNVKDKSVVSAKESQRSNEESND